MAKFKVGDRIKLVREMAPVKNRVQYVGKSGEITEVCGSREYSYAQAYNTNFTGTYVVYEDEIELVSRPTVVTVVITTDGVTTTATLREGKRVIRTATSKCSPSDTFDLFTGAQLALDRLKVKPKPAAPEFSQERYDMAKRICDISRLCVPFEKYERKHDCPFYKMDKGGMTCNHYAATHPETQKLMEDYLKAEAAPEKPKFLYKVGDRVFDINEKCNATVIRVDEADRVVPYKVKNENGAEYWRCEQNLCEAEPEKPKYYTGKVVCVKSGYPWWTVGKVYNIVNGTITANDGDKYRGYISAEDARHAGRTLWGKPFPGSDAGHNPNNEFIPFVEE